MLSLAVIRAFKSGHPFCPPSFSLESGISLFSWAQQRNQHERWGHLVPHLWGTMSPESHPPWGLENWQMTSLWRRLLEVNQDSPDCLLESLLSREALPCILYQLSIPSLSTRVWKVGKLCKTFGWQVSLSRAPRFDFWGGIHWGAVPWTSEGQFTKLQAHLPCQLWAAVCRGVGLVLLVKHWGALPGQFCLYLPAPITYGNRSNPLK